MTDSLPLFNHDFQSKSVFTPEDLIKAVRRERHLSLDPIPEVCVLEFDGDLTDWLVSTRSLKTCKSRGCFHTTMFLLEVDDILCGVVSRTIGGPYAVLVAEQMAVSGARLILGLTSAGRVNSEMPIPGLVSVTGAIRDEGTSYHYLPPAAIIEAPTGVENLLKCELEKLPIPSRSGIVWTTDAPYRETDKEFLRYVKAGALAVEMQAASLLAFSAARKFPVGITAHVTNDSYKKGDVFDKGFREQEYRILDAICRAGIRYVSTFDRKRS